MFYLVIDNRATFRFSSAGNLVNNEGFLHGDRCLDTFVLLVGNEGQMHIAQGQTRYILGPNQYMVLYPHMRHYGYMKSENLLNYYWCHFYIEQERYSIVEHIDEIEFGAILEGGGEQNFCVLPEFGECLHAERVHLQFRRLIDSSRQRYHMQSVQELSITLLVQEMAFDFMLESVKARDNKKVNPSIERIKEYVQMNYASDINVQKLALRFGYNPNYLSAAFRRSTGIPLLNFINRTRIDAAKTLLLNSSNPIKFIAAQVGFEDEKHFMKLFRTYEKTTPTKFRNVYFHTHTIEK